LDKFWIDIFDMLQSTFRADLHPIAKLVKFSKMTKNDSFEIIVFSTPLSNLKQQIYSTFSVNWNPGSLISNRKNLCSQKTPSSFFSKSLKKHQRTHSFIVCSFTYKPFGGLCKHQSLAAASNTQKTLILSQSTFWHLCDFCSDLQRTQATLRCFIIHHQYWAHFKHKALAGTTFSCSVFPSFNNGKSRFGLFQGELNFKPSFIHLLDTSWTSVWAYNIQTTLFHW
jgi:hypothetical protein